MAYLDYEGLEYLKGKLDNTYETIADANGLKSAIYDIAKEQYGAISYTTATTSGYINISDGTVSSQAGYSCTDFIDITPYKLLKYKRMSMTWATTSCGMAFYDSTKTFLSSVPAATSQASPGYVSELQVLDIPTGAKYARFSFHTGSTYGDFELYGITAIATDVKDVKSQLTTVLSFEQWTKATFNADGLITQSGNGAVSGIVRFLENDVVHCEANSRFIVAFYDSDNVYIGKVAADGSINKTSGDWKFFTGNTKVSNYAPNNATQFLICLLPTDSTTLTDGNVTQWANSHSNIITNVLDNIPNIQNALNGDVSSYMHSQFTLHMTHSGTGEYTEDNRRNAIIKPLHFLCDVSISCPNNKKFAYQRFDGYEIGSAHLVFASAWLTTAVIPAGSYWCMIVANSDDSTTDITTQDSLVFSVNMTADDVYYRLLQLWGGNSYVVGADSIKRGVETDALGSLTYAQSFCMYDGNYYSTDGSNIGVQDGSFNAVSTTALSVGHGNAFQLGHNGKAYISGWDDQKIYVVDMESLTIDSIITLPTTGYTTAVIDDLNKIAYIFQRDSYPDTVVNYNFIVYDYQAQEVKSTRVINAFSAMQAADYYNGRIAVLWGLGTAADPSGMAVYNTAGDMLEEFTLSVFKKTEPEGVFFDRTTGELLVSTVNKSVYRIC